MKKLIVMVVFLLATIFLLSGCVPSSKEPIKEGVKINFYDADGNLIGSSRDSSASTQSIITVPLNKIPLEAVSIGFEVIASNDGEVPVTVTYTKADFIGEFE